MGNEVDRSIVLGSLLMAEKPSPTCVGLIVTSVDEPALFFSSAARAESYLEAIDVREGTYPAAFGPHGELYDLGTNGDKVVITRNSAGAADAPRLARVLVRFLSEVGLPTDPSDLPSLVDRCRSYVDDW